MAPMCSGKSPLIHSQASDLQILWVFVRFEVVFQHYLAPRASSLHQPCSQPCLHPWDIPGRSKPQSIP